jgi:hypothetical protein
MNTTADTTTTEDGETDSSAVTSATAATGGDGDGGDGDGQFDTGDGDTDPPQGPCGSYDGAFTNLTVTGSEVATSCDTPFFFQGTVTVAAPDQIIVDACPCDQDCGNESPQSINFGGGDAGEVFEVGMCVRVEGTKPSNCYQARLIIEEQNQAQFHCPLAYAYYHYGENQANIPSLLLSNEYLSAYWGDDNLCPGGSEDQQSVRTNIEIEHYGQDFTLNEGTPGVFDCEEDPSIETRFDVFRARRNTPDPESEGYVRLEYSRAWK